MTFSYAPLATLSLDLLTEFGQDVTRRTYTAGAYDPATGTTVNTTADTTRKGALFDYNIQGAGAGFVRGTLVRSGDRQLLLDATGPVNQEDRFVVNGLEYAILTIGETSPGGTRVIFDIHLRR